jgi:RHS repeat-associated protein
MSNSEGQLVWRASYKTWGNTVAESWQITDLDGERVYEDEYGDIPQEQLRQQNLRFQGQYFDRDTGLHYNTLRYYDPDIGRFISPDPIGLGGGLNLGSYAPNPISWIDPWGLAPSIYLDFSGHWALFPAGPGEFNEVIIKLQGSRQRDFTLAFEQSNIPKSRTLLYTWHHADFDKATGRARMQLVLKSEHSAIPHKGSVSDFQTKFKVKYGSKKARDLVDNRLKWRHQC